MTEPVTKPSTVDIDWKTMEDWDRRYYIHNIYAQDEYNPIFISKTEGRHIYLQDGTKVLDFMSQLISDNMGQRHPKVISGIKDALDRYGHVYFAFSTDYRARASKLLVEDIIQDDWAGRVRFLSTGTEGVEMALLMAKLYTGRPYIITQEYAFHGWTTGAGGGCTRIRGYSNNLASPTDPNSFQEVPGFPTPGYYVAPAPYCYRCPVGHTYPDCKSKEPVGSLPCLRPLEHLIEVIGAENIAAVITEIMFGGAGIYSPPEYIPQLREITRKHGILWIDDEVITGFGRLGKWFGYQLYKDTYPDIMVIGKGLTSCALPSGGVVVNKEIGEFFDQQRWWSGSSHEGHPITLAAIVATLEAMIEEDIVSVAAETGKYLETQLRQLEPRHKSIGQIAGAGMFWVIDLVKNQERREPFVKEDRNSMRAGDLSHWPINIVMGKCLEKGVFLTGFTPNTLKIGPALTSTREEIDQGLEALDYALDTVDEMCD
ncbi:MAG: aspartate aminotransferase family protein [Acidobacteria bacterium]|nr:aspartate aminotransferase family protein [Acidobacteriota bacterium]